MTKNKLFQIQQFELIHNIIDLANFNFQISISDETNSFHLEMKNPEEINSKFLNSLTKLNLELPNYISSTEIRKHLSSSSPSSNFYHKNLKTYHTINQYLKLLENWENMSDLLIQLIKLSKDKVKYTDYIVLYQIFIEETVVPFSYDSHHYKCLSKNESIWQKQLLNLMYK